MELEKNQIIELAITGYTSEGNGVGRYRGIAVFVPQAAAGDLLSVKIVKTAKNYAFGRVEKILSPSKDRIPSDCPQFSRCGGCAFRHISYEAECKAKQQRVQDAVERIAGFHFAVLQPIICADRPDRYRNKAQLPVGGGPGGEINLGFYASRSHRIIDCGECLLQPEVFAAAEDAFREWERQTREDVYDEKTGRGHLRHLFLRLAEATGEVMACVVVNGNGVHREPELVELLKKKVPGLKSVVVNNNRERTNVILGPKCRTVWGQDTITDELCGLRFRISPLSFYQVNRRQAERLYGLAAKYAGLSGGETVLDLYCGTGTIGLSMAKNAGKVVGVEIVPQAVEDAKRNAAENGIDNAEFVCMDAAKAADMLKNRGEKPDVVILDPPRKGCDEALIGCVAQMAPQRVVYVSCDPETLARDLKRFALLGYKTMQVTPVDLFPRTANCEVCCLLTKQAL
ncbi:23S rRNA (uracil(1939)-C(5))-methyltransferase RlmD [Caproiciproducens sp. NJN-50]|uniref:23S rRNA (uracil(1939)-C(5))-methyltransferase RlmD n=1 Tax=Acutalibacteraceae TaxID=3082771 RepID=UPI000FFE14B3|nr:MULTISPECIES: 23S rRNA (uracil(1939)-C(5))-methyltransferase RlmD [Acutalibacteraceae]QAT48825.1 23S rRNA (uracil(1939)-C(5))-methyltransferase RlmD [Caproiciproducens sp. NJN-50]